MPIISTKIPPELKERMNKLSDINWSEIMRRALIKRVEEEERKKIARDDQEIQKSIELMDSLVRKATGNTTEELRKWRETRN